MVTAQVAGGGEPAAARRGHGVWRGGGGRNVPVLLTPSYGRDDGITVPRAAGLLRVRGGSCGAWGGFCQRHSPAVGIPDTTRRALPRGTLRTKLRRDLPEVASKLCFLLKTYFPFRLCLMRIISLRRLSVSYFSGYKFRDTED